MKIVNFDNRIALQALLELEIRCTQIFMGTAFDYTFSGTIQENFEYQENIQYLRSMWGKMHRN
jgi:hypothetical protein